MSDNSIQRVVSFEDSKPSTKTKKVEGSKVSPSLVKSSLPTRANVLTPPSVPPRVSKVARTRGQSTSVYFNNGADLDYLEEVSRTSTASISSIMSQLLAAFVRAHKGKADGNIVKIDGENIQL